MAVQTRCVGGKSQLCFAGARHIIAVPDQIQPLVSRPLVGLAATALRLLRRGERRHRVRANGLGVQRSVPALGDRGHFATRQSPAESGSAWLRRELAGQRLRRSHPRLRLAAIAAGTCAWPPRSPSAAHGERGRPGGGGDAFAIGVTEHPDYERREAHARNPPVERNPGDRSSLAVVPVAISVDPVWTSSSAQNLGDHVRCEERHAARRAVQAHVFAAAARHRAGPGLARADAGAVGQGWRGADAGAKARICGRLSAIAAASGQALRVHRERPAGVVDRCRVR